jgi:tripartite-type tricarboxylate transporter receptor subunit TctC
MTDYLEKQTPEELFTRRLNMKSKAPHRLLQAATAAALFVMPFLATAQDYPKRPITIVVPFAAGGGTDSIARELGKDLTEKLGQPVIIDNRGGGGGAIASRLVAKSDPDGYTLLFVTSTFVTHAATEAKSSYDVNKDYAPVAMLGRGPLMVVTHKSVGAKSLKDLIAATKAKPEGLDYCSSGTGSVTHLAGELFRQRTGANLTHVPYKGSGPATVDFLAGRTHAFFATMPTMLQHVKAGTVDLLAVTGAKRSALFPTVPTVAEAGIAKYDITTWWGIVAPAGTPEPIVKKLNALINEAAAKDPIKGRLTNEGAEAYRATPGEFRSMLASEYAMWKEVVKSGNIKLD